MQWRRAATCSSGAWRCCASQFVRTRELRHRRAPREARLRHEGDCAHVSTGLGRANGESVPDATVAQEASDPSAVEAGYCHRGRDNDYQCGGATDDPTMIVTGFRFMSPPWHVMGTSAFTPRERVQITSQRNLATSHCGRRGDSHPRSTNDELAESGIPPSRMSTSV
jgi:hypothetical protein